MGPARHLWLVLAASICLFWLTSAQPLYQPSAPNVNESVLDRGNYYSTAASLSLSLDEAKATLSKLPVLRVGVALNIVPPSVHEDHSDAQLFLEYSVGRKPCRTVHILLRTFRQDSEGWKAWSTAPYGTATRISQDDMTGLLHWIIGYLEDTMEGNLTFELYAIRPPHGLQVNSDTTVRALYTLDALGMDMALYESTITANRLHYLRFSRDYMQYTHQVVVQTPPIVNPTGGGRLWLWVQPFTWDLWLLLLFCVVFSSLLQHVLDRQMERSLLPTPLLPENDFFDDIPGEPQARYRVPGAPPQPPRPDLAIIPTTMEELGYALNDVVLRLFENVMSLVGTNNETPSSSAGRQFWAVKSFMLYILMASYLASFTAQLSGGAALGAQTITSFDSFWQQNVPACIANNSVTINFMKMNYPKTKLIIMHDDYEILQAVLSGQCAGAVSNELHWRYELSYNDTAGQLCSLIYAGDPNIVSYSYAMAYTRDTSRLPDVAVRAIDKLFEAAITEGAYMSPLTEFVPRGDRPQCRPYTAALQAQLAVSGAALSSSDMAGLFVVIACSGGFAALIPALHRLVEDARKGRAARESQQTARQGAAGRQPSAPARATSADGKAPEVSGPCEAAGLHAPTRAEGVLGASARPFAGLSAADEHGAVWNSSSTLHQRLVAFQGSRKSKDAAGLLAAIETVGERLARIEHAMGAHHQTPHVMNPPH